MDLDKIVGNCQSVTNGMIKDAVLFLPVLLGIVPIIYTKRKRAVLPV